MPQVSRRQTHRALPPPADSDLLFLTMHWRPCFSVSLAAVRAQAAQNVTRCACYSKAPAMPHAHQSTMLTLSTRAKRATIRVRRARDPALRTASPAILPPLSGLAADASRHAQTALHGSQMYRARRRVVGLAMQAVALATRHAHLPIALLVQRAATSRFQALASRPARWVPFRILRLRRARALPAMIHAPHAAYRRATAQPVRAGSS